MTQGKQVTKCYNTTRFAIRHGEVEHDDLGLDCLDPFPLLGPLLGPLDGIWRAIPRHHEIIVHVHKEIPLNRAFIVVTAFLQHFTEGCEQCLAVGLGVLFDELNHEIARPCAYFFSFTRR